MGIEMHDNVGLEHNSLIIIVGIYSSDDYKCY